jgi:regulatory protein
MMSPTAAPTEQSLYEAAVDYLARYAATTTTLTRVLDHRVERWARLQGEAAEDVPALFEAVRRVVARLEAAGAVSNEAFAAARVRSLTRAGRSRRAIAAHLAARGVAGETARTALPEDPETELAAALALARRRRIGPFRNPGATVDPARERGMLARAGFGPDVADAALAMDPDRAEEMVARLRRA